MSWLDKNQNKILIGIWSVIFLTCLLVIFSDPVHAESSNSLPYQVQNLDSWSNADGYTISDLQQFYDGRWGQYYPLDFSSSGTFVYEYVETIVYYGTPTDFNFTVVLCPNSAVPTRSNIPYYYFDSWSSVYNVFDVSTDNVYFHGNNYGGVTFSSYRNQYNDPGFSGIGNQTVRLFGSYYFPTASSSDFFDNSSSNTGENIVFGLPSSTPNITGHSQPPVDDNGHYIEDGNGNRIPKPNKPTPSVYTPPSIQFPTIDTSSLEKLVESLIDLVQYFISYIGGIINGWFSNLLSNLDSWFDYVVQSFNYAINNVVGAIKDLASTFYNNMVSLFEPLYEFFNGVATFFNNLIQLGIDGDSFSLSTFFYNLLVPDPEDFSQTLIYGDIHHVVPLVQAVRSKFVSLFDSFYNLTPTKVFLIPSFTWHGQTFNLSIDFSWYDEYKVYGDSIITGFLVIGYIYWFVLQLNSMFRGGNSIGHDVMKAGGKE